MNQNKNSTDLRLLSIGAFVGLVVAGMGILQKETSVVSLPENTIARVNDVMISRDQYERAILRSTNYAGQPVGGDDSAMLQRLIDEELLIQRGMDLGMTQSDLAVRQAIIDSLIASITAEADAASPSDEELTQYLANNEDRFSYVSKIDVQAWQSDDESAAQSFISALRADGSADPQETIQMMPDLPEGLMTLDILGDYLGPGISAATAEMPEGSSAVFARRGRWLVVRINAKERSAVTDIERVRNRVLIDYRRNLADERLTDYIEDLRLRADIAVANP